MSTLLWLMLKVLHEEPLTLNFAFTLSFLSSARRRSQAKPEEVDGTVQSMDLNKLNPGFYLLAALLGKEVFIRKFVKQ